MSKKIAVKEPPAVEFNLSTTSSDEFTYALSGTSEEEDEDEELAEALAHINITDHLSTLALPDVLLEAGDPFKNTELVLKFSPNIRLAALQWFIERVTAPKSKGGAELLLLREPYYGKPKEGLTIHVTAATWRHLEVAEQLDIKKMDYSMLDPAPREFKLSDIYKFMKDDMDPEDILTPAEKQMVVLHELKHLHSRPGERHIPGYEKFKLITGASIFNMYVTRNLITSYFPLHEEKLLSALEGRWFNEFFQDPPYGSWDIRSYFGDRTCLYFNFVAYYTFWLSIPAFLGFCHSIFVKFVTQDTFQLVTIPICLFNMIFVTIFLVLWQRHQSRITYKWGTIKLNVWEEPRPNYHGTLALDPVTGSLQRRYPYYKTFIKTYFVSLFIVLLSSILAVWVMHIFQVLDREGRVYASQRLESAQDTIDIFFWEFVFPIIPTAVYGSLVFLTTRFYRKFANFLTEWENHRTESQFDKHLISKMVVFDVVNNFGILYYTAFVLKNNTLLGERVFSMLAVVQILLIVDQCVRPVVFRQGATKMHQFLEQKRFFAGIGVVPTYNESRKPIPYPGLEQSNMSVMNVDDPRVQISKVEGSMDPYDYEAEFDEYVCLVIQFGYTFLFSAAYPAAALYAFLGNILVLMSSLFKRREVFQRTIARRISSIGAWKQAFDLLAVIAVMTNCALLGINPKLREMFPQYSDNEWFFLFICVEHAVLVIQYVVKKFIPKIPYRVRVGLAASEFKSHQALKREQATNTRKRVSRYFSPINEKIHHRDRSGGQTSKPRLSDASDKPPDQLQLRKPDKEAKKKK